MRKSFREVKQTHDRREEIDTQSLAVPILLSNAVSGFIQQTKKFDARGTKN